MLSHCAQISHETEARDVRYEKIMQERCCYTRTVCDRRDRCNEGMGECVMSGQIHTVQSIAHNDGGGCVRRKTAVRSRGGVDKVSRQEMGSRTFVRGVTERKELNRQKERTKGNKE